MLDNGVGARSNHLGSMVSGIVFAGGGDTGARAGSCRAARGAGRAAGRALVDINAAAAAGHCHRFVLVVGLCALFGKLLVDDRLGVESWQL